MDILQCWFDPDFASWAADLGEARLALRFNQVEDGGGSVRPFSEERGRVVRGQKLIATNAMSANHRSTSELADSGTTSESPQSSVAQSNNEIRIASENFVSKSVQLGLKLSADVFAGEEWTVGLDTVRLPTTEPFKPVPSWSDIEDVGSIHLRV